MLEFNKPNKYKLIIAFILILLNFISLVYLFSFALCDVPSCPKDNSLSVVLSPIVYYAYSPFHIQNQLADLILYKKTYITEDTYTVEPKYPVPVEYAIRAIFILFALLIYLILCYLVSCILYRVYEKIKFSFSKAL